VDAPTHTRSPNGGSRLSPGPTTGNDPCDVRVSRKAPLVRGRVSRLRTERASQDKGLRRAHERRIGSYAGDPCICPGATSAAGVSIIVGQLCLPPARRCSHATTDPYSPRSGLANWRLLARADTPARNPATTRPAARLASTSRSQPGRDAHTLSQTRRIRSTSRLDASSLHGNDDHSVRAHAANCLHMPLGWSMLPPGARHKRTALRLFALSLTTYWCDDFAPTRAADGCLPA